MKLNNDGSDGTLCPFVTIGINNCAQCGNPTVIKEGGVWYCKAHSNEERDLIRREQFEIARAEYYARKALRKAADK